MNVPPRAVIIGLNGPNPLGLIRSLGKKSIQMIGIGFLNEENIAIYSKYLKRKDVILLKKDSDPTETLLIIANRYKMKQRKGIIFLSDEKEILTLYNNRNLLKDYYELPFRQNINPEDLIDKKNNIEIARNSGFGIPKTFYLSEYRNELKDKKFIIKAKNSIIGNKQTISTSSSKNLIAFTKNRNIDDLIIQERIITKKTTDFVFVNSYLLKDGSTYISGMYKRLHARTAENAKSLRVYSTAYESFWDKSLEKIVIKLTKRLNWPYALSIDLAKNSIDNRYYVLEVNLRQGAEHFGQTLAGNNLPAVIYFDKIGDKTALLTAVSHNYIQKHCYILENRELSYLLLDREASILQSLKPFLRTKLLFCYYQITDILPFIIQIFIELKYYLKLIFKKQTYAR